VAGTALWLLACSHYDAELLPRTSSDPPGMDAAVSDDAAPPDRTPGGEAGAPAADAAPRDGATQQRDGAERDADEPGDASADAGSSEDEDADVDWCPGDADKTDPGVCGCGVPESCVGLRDALVHRYRFEGAGTTVRDTKGTAHGTLIGAALPDNGTLTLAGGTSDQYVDLPNRLISGLQDVTIEAWVTWSGGDPWQRIFDFGDSTAASEGTQDMGRSHLFITPQGSGSSGTNLLALFRTPAGEVVAQAAAPLATNVMKHVAVVVDGAGDLMTLYLDGQPAASIAFTAALSDVNDINNWIGRSQWLVDAEFGGVVHELRIYAAALGSSQLANSFAAGPDPGFLDP
jgi:hypothetical protein